MSGQAARLAALVEASVVEQAGRPLPVGVFHLVIADDDLVHRARQMRLTVCGAVVAPSGLPPSCFPEGGEIDRDPRYCPECVIEAVRWCAQARGVAGE